MAVVVTPTMASVGSRMDGSGTESIRIALHLSGEAGVVAEQRDLGAVVEAQLGEDV
jgi:hypothetical protein